MIHATRATALPARVMIIGSATDARVVADTMEGAGHEVVRSPSLGGALPSVTEQQPDVVVVAARDPRDGAALEFCALVRAQRSGPRPAVFLLTSGAASGAARKGALRAGAWHVLDAPVDPEEVLLLVDVALDARRDADRAMAVSLVDAETGLYNMAGLARRTRELSAEAMRTHTTLACVVISAEVDGLGASRAAASRSSEVLRTLGRVSDVIGRVGSLEYVVLAPATPGEGALQLSRRLSTAFRIALIQALPHRAHVRVLAGHSAMPNLAYAPLEPAEILTRASNALRIGRGAPHFEWLPPHGAVEAAQSRLYA